MKCTGVVTLVLVISVAGTAVADWNPHMARVDRPPGDRQTIARSGVRDHARTYVDGPARPRRLDRPASTEKEVSI